MVSPLTHERGQLRRYAARLTAQRGACRVPALVLMTDDDRSVDWVDAVQALPRGAAVIVRARNDTNREALARVILSVAKPRGVHVAIASDAKLAIRLRVAGVHMPENMAHRIASIRRSLPFAFLTISAHGAPGLTRASGVQADAVFLSPIFATQSHPGARALGPNKWAAIRRLTQLPVLALGGIAQGNGRRAIVAGAKGIGVIGSWTQGP